VDCSATTTGELPETTLRETAAVPLLLLQANESETVRADHEKQAETKLFARISGQDVSPAGRHFSDEFHSNPDFQRSMTTAEFFDRTASKTRFIS
jgi:alpha-beta hydrolase superfamily lysophospholipase